MTKVKTCFVLLALVVTPGLAAWAEDSNTEPKVPRFSMDYLDRSVSPAMNFYEFAVGQ